MSATSLKLRVVTAKPGPDGHDRGAEIVAPALRDGGWSHIHDASTTSRPSKSLARPSLYAGGADHGDRGVDQRRSAEAARAADG